MNRRFSTRGMDVRRLHRLAISCLCASLLAFAACSDPDGGPAGPGDPTDPDPPPADTIIPPYRWDPPASIGGGAETVSADVTLPAGSEVDPSALQLLAPLELTAPLGESGTAAVRLYSQGPQLVYAVRFDGSPVLLGWLDPAEGQLTLSARTTAEVLVFYSLRGHTLLDPLQPILIRALRDDSRVDPLETALAQALSAASFDLESAMATLQPLREQVVEEILTALMANGGWDGASAHDVIVQPDGLQSGIRVLSEGLDRVTVENQYRLRRKAFVDRVSPGSEEITSLDLSPPPGVTSIADASVDIAVEWIYGYQMEYAGVTSDPIHVPLHPEDAERTDYQITVIGAGNLAPAVALSSDRRQEQQLLTARTLLLDMAFPFVMTTLMPLGSEALQAYLGTESAQTAMEAFVTAVVQAGPGFLEKANEGDWKGAQLDFYNALMGQSWLQELVSGLIADLVELPFQLTGQGGSGARMDNARTGLFNVLGLGDALLTAFDTGRQGVELVSSRQAEVFDVTVAPTRVNLLPAYSTVALNGEVQLEAILPAAGDDAFEYRWWTSGEHGTLDSGLGPQGTEITTSSRTVTYHPNGQSSGEDRVWVAVYQTGGGSKVGQSDTVTVRVIDVEVSITPSETHVRAGQTVEFLADVLPAHERGEFYYRWQTSGNHGTVNWEEGIWGEWLEYTANGNAQSGNEDWVRVEVYLNDPLTNSPVGEPVATAEASVTIDDHVIDGSMFVETTTFQVSTEERYCIVAYIAFPLVEDATGYDVHAYGITHPQPSQQELHLSFLAPFEPHPTEGCPGSTARGTSGDQFLYRVWTGTGPTGPCAACDPNRVLVEERWNGYIAGATVRVRVSY